MWKRWKSGWQKTYEKTKIHQNLSINDIDNRQINAIIESTKENIVNRKEAGKMKVVVKYCEVDEQGKKHYRTKTFYSDHDAREFIDAHSKPLHRTWWVVNVKEM